MAVVTITTENFAQEVLHSDKPVLLDFWASCAAPAGCSPPLWTRSQQNAPISRLERSTWMSSRSWPSQFGVMSIPTLMVFRTAQPPAPPWALFPRQRFSPCYKITADLFCRSAVILYGQITLFQLFKPHRKRPYQHQCDHKVPHTVHHIPRDPGDPPG